MFRLFPVLLFIFLMSPDLPATEIYLDFVHELDFAHEWNFAHEETVQAWKEMVNHLDIAGSTRESFKATVTGVDPFIGLTGLEIPVKPFQYIEFVLKTDISGKGELFYSNDSGPAHQGLSQAKYLVWTAFGDEKWHTYRIYPDWQSEGMIRKLRLDFPPLAGERADKPYVEIRSIRVATHNHRKKVAFAASEHDFSAVQGNWFPLDTTEMKYSSQGLQIQSSTKALPVVESGFFLFTPKTNPWISLELATDTMATGRFEWLSDKGKMGDFDFAVIPDGKFHRYNIDTSRKKKNISGLHHLFRISFDQNDSGSVTIGNLVISDSPQGPPEIVVDNIWFSEPINRAGKIASLSMKLTNLGGTVSEDLKITRLTLPGGEKIVSPDGWEKLPKIEPMQTMIHTVDILCEKPQECIAVLRFDAPQRDYVAGVNILPDLKLSKADYVPEPKPVESDYEIGAFYFPGWAKADQWERIIATHPERKPVLGWYDEASPEVIDWQIKWAVENGLKFFLVDWYWSRGNQHLDHWVKGFQQARYKSHLKWAMMWANHNGPGSHSEEDQAKVTQFWIDNYFHTPEYYTIDGKPVVMIWSPEGMDEDIIKIEAAKGNTLQKGQGVKKLLDLSRKMAQDAGLKGIYFIAMKWPEASTEARDIQWLADAGFDMTSIYHFMHHGGKAENPMRFPFDLVVDANKLQWDGLQKTGILPFLPNLSTGWDSRPWHGNEQVIIENRSANQFRVICEDFVKFSNRTGIKRAILGPLNEWGEGSYVEPNLEHGFGMYEVLREVFCKEPVEGWPLNYAPDDVGLGPYDLPVKVPGQ